MWETFDSPTDIGLRASGNSLAEAFGETAKGLFAQMAYIEHFENDIEVDIECNAERIEDVLLAFLNRLLTESAIHSAVFHRFEFSELNEKSVMAKAIGEKINGRNKQYLRRELKGVCYNGLSVETDKKEFRTQIIIDV